MVFRESIAQVDFHIPSFREGGEGCEFNGGYSFERFMFGLDSSGASVSPNYEYCSFKEELKSAREFAIQMGLTYEGLMFSGRKPFSCYLFEEVKNFIPSKYKSELEMYVTLGTPLDLVHGVDMVFCLLDRFVSIDVTIDPFNKNKPKRGNHLIFSHYNLSQKQTNLFAKKVVKILKRNT